MATLHAWARPVGDAPVFDHTWVTDFPFSNGEYPNFGDLPNGARFWFCWGDYHAEHRAGGALCSAVAQGDPDRIVRPNTPPTDPPGTGRLPQNGTIDFYGVDGVCHQVSNQVLYLTGTSDDVPQRVIGARGYHLSSFFFTNYGLNHAAWRACAAEYAPTVKAPDDDFVVWMDATLSDLTLKESMEIGVIRSVAHASYQRIHGEVTQLGERGTYERIGAITLTALVALGACLGVDRFRLLFPDLAEIPKDIESAVAWLDPSMVEQAAARRIEAIGKG